MVRNYEFFISQMLNKLLRGVIIIIIAMVKTVIYVVVMTTRPNNLINYTDEHEKLNTICRTNEVTTK